ncbi:MAG: hypothetical protein J5982_02225 [Bacilli bacterium]|nr:hypothetical protein [Bacilli bacterium]
MLRNSINGAWLFGIIITFMAILIAYISISINYSKAYEMKTKMITIIEEYDGLNPSTVEYLNRIAANYGYRKTNTCKVENGEKFVGIRDGVPTINPSESQNICITRELKEGSENIEKKYYYNLEVFFGFDLPLLGNLFTFRVSGETNAIYYPADSDYFR